MVQFFPEIIDSDSLASVKVLIKKKAQNA